MNNSFQYLVSLSLLLLLTTTTVVNGRIAQFKALEQQKCMGNENLGYLYMYECDLEIAYEFEWDGRQLIAAEGDFAGKCLSNEYDYWPILEECDTSDPKQLWRLQDDGRLIFEVTGDNNAKEEWCLKQILPTTRLKVDIADSIGDCIQWFDPATGAFGDPIIMGLKGQQFKFDGRDGGWYANLAAKEYQWNMKFKKFDTCPEGDDMFVSSLAYSFGDSEDNKESKILIVTTPQAIPQCKKDGNVCLGHGTLHISFDGGETFASNPADYNFALGSRLVAHNTYAACSRKWFDYDLSEAAAAKAKDKHLRGEGDEDTRELKNTESKKTSLQYLTEKKRSMINPTECEHWIQERFEQNDLFLQGGEWSTIHIETPTVSLHIEYRRDNSQREVDGQCNFQSLDSWMTNVSPSLHNDVWNGILGETRTGDETDKDRLKILRGKKDADYEVDGPFGRSFPALHLSTTGEESSSSKIV